MAIVEQRYACLCFKESSCTLSTFLGGTEKLAVETYSAGGIELEVDWTG